MRVLMLTQFYPPVVGGQERYVRDLAQALAGRGHDIEVATIANDGVPGMASDGPVLVHRLRTTMQRLPGLYSDPERPHSLPVADPALRAGLERLVSSRGYDVVHAHDWSVNSLLAPARRAGVPVLVTQHDYSHVCATKRMMRGRDVCPGPALGACLRCAARQYGTIVGPGVVAANAVGRRARLRRVSMFLPVSESVRHRTGLNGSAPVEILPNFVPDEILVDPGSARLSDDAKAPILFVGDLTEDKGVGVLVAAYARLVDPPPLVLVGRRFPELSVEPKPGIELPGLVGPTEVRRRMHDAAVVVVPSIVPDACPSVVLEAMAAARPVVATTSGGITDLVDHGRTGVLVAPGDPDALATALSSVLADPAAALDMGLQGLERVRRFTASRVADRLEGLYRRVTSAAAGQWDGRGA
jgi:glycosyltransferase involved in cell wall biosynthesis